MALRLTTVGLLGLCMWSTVHAHEIEPFNVRYEVHHSGARVAETTLTLRHDDDGRYTFVSRSEPKGLAKWIRPGKILETSVFGLAGDRLIPFVYDFDDGSAKGARNSHIDFDWAALSAHSRYKGEATNVALQYGSVDRLLVQLMMMRDLADDALPTTYAVVDRNEIKHYDVTFVARETLATPAGKFATVKVRRQRAGSSRATLIWAASAHGFLPVKMVQLKDERPNTVLTVLNFEGRPAQDEQTPAPVAEPAEQSAAKSTAPPAESGTKVPVPAAPAVAPAAAPATAPVPAGEAAEPTSP